MLTQQEFEKLRTNLKINPIQFNPETSGYFSRVGESIKKEVLGGVEAVRKGAEIVAGAAVETKPTEERIIAPLAGAARSALGVTGATIRATLSPVTEFLSPLIEPLIEPIMEIDQVEEIVSRMDDWAKENPVAAKNLVDTIDVISVLGVGTVGKKAVEKAATKQVLKTVGGGGVGAVGRKAVIGTVEKTAELGRKTIKRPIQRAAINIAEKKAETVAIKSLPKAGQEAVSGGILLRDAQLITSANKAEKSIFRNMVERAKEFSLNRQAKDPASLVGREFRKRIETLETLRGKVGKKLGVIAQKISSKKVVNVKETVLEELRKVRGLEGLKINSKGVLDFSDTVLSGSLTKSDRNIIQNAFNDLKNRSAGGLHRLRQEIFESLGGKKAAKVEFTETQEKALNAIRKGVADVLEQADSQYKILNKEYAQIAEPLKEVRRLFKRVIGADEDILDMKAGLLSRRLTSNTQSGPEIRQLLRNMEKIAAENGVKFDISVDKLQDFFNALDRYYDIAKDTSFAGQTRIGTETLPTTRDFARKILEKSLGTFGTTKAVQRKALDDLLKSLIGG